MFEPFCDNVGTNQRAVLGLHVGQYYLDYLVYVGGHIGFNDNIMANSHQ